MMETSDKIVMCMKLDGGVVAIISSAIIGFQMAAYSLSSELRNLVVVGT